MSGQQLLFWVFAVASCAGAVAVVVSQNVVRMAFWLIVSLGSVAGLFFLLHADFVAATQLLIYVGGTAVLMIFGVMLTASGPYVKIKTSPAEGFLGAGIGVLILLLIFFSVTEVDWNQAAKRISRAQANTGKPSVGHNPAQEGNTARLLGLSFLGLRPDKDLNSNAGQKGYSQTGQLSNGYLLPFEIASVHLLVVLIGAAYLARAKRRVERDDGPK